jgi:putative acetyltransferase
MITVDLSDPMEEGAARLLRESHALMQRLFDPEDNHFLSIEALRAPDIRFFTAREGDTILGTCALRLAADHGEVKSMFVAEQARGRGVGALLLARIEKEARAHDLPALMLETGDVLAEAHRLYARAGFTPRGPFGGYEAAPRSIFLEKPLP